MGIARAANTRGDRCCPIDRCFLLGSAATLDALGRDLMSSSSISLTTGQGNGSPVMRLDRT